MTTPANWLEEQLLANGYALIDGYWQPASDTERAWAEYLDALTERTLGSGGRMEHVSAPIARVLARLEER